VETTVHGGGHQVATPTLLAPVGDFLAAPPKFRFQPSKRWERKKPRKIEEWAPVAL
jgi:hypothetical protein